MFISCEPVPPLFGATAVHVWFPLGDDHTDRAASLQAWNTRSLAANVDGHGVVDC